MKFLRIIKEYTQLDMICNENTHSELKVSLLFENVDERIY